MIRHAFSAPRARRARGRAATALLPLALLALFAPTACSTAPTRASAGMVAGPESIGPGRYELEVLGMSCPKCISNVDLQLARIAGVGEVAVDMKNGLVTLSVAAGAEVSRDRLAAAVEDAGFTLRAIRGERPR
jgi:mercuric ion binding protein